MGEDQKDNDLFFVCSLIECIARKTNNTKKYVVTKLGKETIQKIYELADVYHSENIEKVTDEFIEKCHLEKGSYDVTKDCKYRVPTIWELGRIYQRLVIMVNLNKERYIDTLIEVLTSWIIPKIDNYDSSMYYENPEYIYECYVQNKII